MKSSSADRRCNHEGPKQTFRTVHGRRRCKPRHHRHETGFGRSADPIYAVIEQHRKAAAEHLEALRVQFAYEEHGGIKGERLEEYQRLDGETDEAYRRMEDASGELVNTKPTTLAGIVALCRYIGPLFEGDDSPDLPEYISYDDDTQETPAESLCHRSVQQLRN
jgi:hypothetical protein